MKNVQIEVTTYCNLKCFYCPIESIKHKHMTFDTFKGIIDSLEEPSYILLQGTGESLLNKELHSFMKYAKTKNHKLRLITNGTIELKEDYLKELDHILYSVDEYNSELQVKNFVDQKINFTENSAVIMVDYGQNKQEIINQVENNYIFVQPLQTMSNYQEKYKNQDKSEIKQSYNCNRIKNKEKFFFVSGKEAPCCYMLHEDKALSREEVSSLLNKGHIPKICTGCREIYGNNLLDKTINSIKQTKIYKMYFMIKTNNTNILKHNIKVKLNKIKSKILNKN